VAALDVKTVAAITMVQVFVASVSGMIAHGRHHAVNPRLAVVGGAAMAAGSRHLPAAIAGNIYRALSPRFGTQIDFKVAEADDDESTNTNGKASALNEEAAETKAAVEAEENGEEENSEANANQEKPVDLKVKPTSMPVGDKPKTTVPAKANPKDAPDGRGRQVAPKP